MTFVNDPIGDFLTRIRNAQQRNHEYVTAPSSKMLEAIADILKKENFVEDYEVEDVKPQKKLIVKLRYADNEFSNEPVPAIQNSQRVSKPGVRKYVGYRDIPTIKNGLGISIISTPQGVMKGDDAKTNKVGGELLCYVW